MRTADGPPAGGEPFRVLLRRHRVAAALSQEALAARAGLSTRAVSDLERGVKQRPYLATVRRLADALGLGPTERAALAAAGQTDAAMAQPASPGASGPVPRPVGPMAPNPLVGREGEVAAVADLFHLPAVRLVTLTGPGGVGKTRLAVAVAHAEEVATAFPDGVRFVDLSPVIDPNLVLPTIARALGVRGAGGRHPAAQLAAWLAARELLLVLDNFEQVVEAAPLVADLLAACPSLAALVTSRVRLRLSAECEVPIAPLPVPGGLESSSAETALSYPAVRLFVERARAVNPGFVLTNETAGSIAAICRRLDGLPLAIELAAARTKVLPPDALLIRLERRLPLLTGGARDLPDRQRTMRDTIAWSYDLLAPEEQACFRRLAVFSGGFTLEAAEFVAGEDSQTAAIVDLVASLVDQSLLRRQDDAAPGASTEPRYLMLETIREYALEQLAASGEEIQTRQRHAAHYYAEVEAAAPTPRWPTTETLVHLLDAECDNLRAALAWLDQIGESERYLRLATWLYPLWYTLGHVGEGRRWLEQGLARGGEAPALVRGLAQGLAGWLAQVQGDGERALLLLQECLALIQTVENSTRADRLDATLMLFSLGVVWEDQGQYEEAERCFAQALPAFRDLGSEASAALTLYHLGVVAYGQGDLKRARAQCAAALAQMRVAGSSLFAAFVLAGLGLVESECGDYPAAATAFAEAFAFGQEAEDYQGTALRLAGVGVLAAGCGSPEVAARLLGAAEAQNRALGMTFPVPECIAYERAADAARTALGEAGFTAAWVAGQALGAEAAVAEARAFVTAVELVPVATAPRGMLTSQ